MASLKKNIFYQTAYRLTISAAPLLTTPYLSRVLGVSNLGLFSYRQSIINFFMLFAMLGITNYGLRSIAGARTTGQDIGKTFSEIYSIQFVSASIVTVAYVIYMLFFVKTDILLSWIFIFYLIGDLFDGTWFFYGMEEIHITSKIGMFIKLLSVISVFTLVKTSADLWKYAIIVSFGTALGQIAVWPSIFKKIKLKKPDFNEVKKHIKPVFILFVPLLAVSVYHTMDKVMLGIMSDSFNSGYYYNADKVVNIPIVIITGIFSVFYPRLSNIYASDGDCPQMRKVQNEAMLGSSVLISAMAFGIAAVSDEFVPVFFGKGYEPCSSLIKYFAVIMIIKSLSSAVRNLYIMPTKHDKIYVFSVASGAVINFIANFIFLYVFRMGALGATLGTLIAELAVAVVEIIMFRKAMPSLNPVKAISSSWFLYLEGIAMFILVRVLRYFVTFTNSNFILLGIEICTGGIFFLGALLIYSKISKKDLLSLALKSRK